MQSILEYNNNIESTNYIFDDDVKIDFSSNYETISGFESVVYIPYQVKPGDRIFKVYTKKHLIDNQAKWLIHNKFLVNTYGCKFININGNNPCLTMYYVSVDLLMAIFIQSKIVLVECPTVYPRSHSKYRINFTRNSIFLVSVLFKSSGIRNNKSKSE